MHAGPGRRGELAFRVGRSEIGHLHGDHAAHFWFPERLWTQLREQGRITEHPIFPGKVGPAARRIEGEADALDVIALMRINYDRVGPSHATPRRLSDAEVQYLTSKRRLGRLATVGEDGTPHVVPVGFSYNPASQTVDIGGRDLTRTRKYRDVKRAGRAAIVVDDLASTDPWRPRAVELRGRAEAIAGPRPLIRIHPYYVNSWGLRERTRRVQ